MTFGEKFIIPENLTKEELHDRLQAIGNILCEQYCHGCNRWHPSETMLYAISLVLRGKYKEEWKKWTWFDGNERLELKFIEEFMEENDEKKT